MVQLKDNLTHAAGVHLIYWLKHAVYQPVLACVGRKTSKN